MPLQTVKMPTTEAYVSVPFGADRYRRHGGTMGVGSDQGGCIPIERSGAPFWVVRTRPLAALGELTMAGNDEMMSFRRCVMR